MIKFFNNLNFMFRFILRHNKLWLFLCIISSSLSIVTPVLDITLPKYIIDSVFQKNDFKAGMIWVLVLVGTNLLIQYLSSIIAYAGAKQKNKLFLSFNVYISEIIMEMEYKDLENPDILDMKERALKSAFSGGHGFCGSVEVFFTIISNILVLFSAAFVVAKLNYILLLLIAVVVVLNTISNSKTTKANYKLDKEKAPIERKNSYVFNLISDFSFGKEVRLYGLKDHIIRKYKNTADESNKFYNKAFFNNTKNRIFSSTTANIQLFIVYFVLLAQVFKNQNFTFGDFSVQFAAVNTLSASLLAIVSSVLSISQMGFYIDDLLQFINLPKKDNTIGLSIPEREVYEFDFVNACFKYPGANDYALKNVNLHFSTRQKLSFVGLNGAGKTTFVKLLLGLYNVTSGEILLNGVNIQKIRYDEYVRLFSTVFQDYKLFAYSVSENIVLNENDYDETKLDHAVRASGVNEFIEGKDNGINSFVYRIFDASGFEPSGGEGQKIAIARAIYKDAKYYILDEPTSALDPIAEFDLYDKIFNLLKDKGCLFISHRLSSTIFADNICVFKNGEIVERGSHKELMQLDDGLYRSMFEKQASYYKETSRPNIEEVVAPDKQT